MRKLASTLGFAKKPTKKDLNSGSKVTCEFWSQGETDATDRPLWAGGRPIADNAAGEGHPAAEHGPRARAGHRRVLPPHRRELLDEP